MVELILSLVIGFLIGLPVGAFALVGWVNRYTRRQAATAQQSLEKLTAILTQAQQVQDGATKVN